VGGSAGLTDDARLKRQGRTDVAVIDPASTHYHQPLWTLVGGGRAPVEASVKPQSKVMPKGVAWIQRAAVGVDPRRRAGDARRRLQRRLRVPGHVPGHPAGPGEDHRPGQTLGRDGVSSNHLYELAPATWKFIRDTRSGTATFTMPSGPIKCAGAPQKIAYLAADYWREQGVLDKVDIHLVLPTPGMFGVKEFSDVLVCVAKRYGITVHLQSEAISVNPDAREVTIADLESSSPSSARTAAGPCA